MHMLAGQDALGQNADGRAIFQDLMTDGEVGQREFVAKENRFAQGDLLDPIATADPGDA